MENKRLKKYRISAGFASYREVAKELKLNPMTYWNIEKGLSKGDFETWKKIQKLFKISNNSMWGVITYVSDSTKRNIQKTKRNKKS